MALTYPPSFLQERMVALARDGKDYDVSVVAWHVAGGLDDNRLELTVRRLVQRHEVLRTALRTIEGRLVQIVEDCDRSQPDISHADIQRDPYRAIATAVQHAASRPFDLHEAPWWSLLVLPRSRDRHVLLWRISHAAWDRYSATVLLRDFAELYRGTGTTSSTQPQLPLQFGHVAARDRATVPSATAAAYWTRALAGVAPRRRLGNPDAARYVGLQQRWPRMPRDEFASLLALARKEGATAPMAILALLALLMAAKRPEAPQVFGVFDANRERSGSDALVGCLVNILLVPLTVPVQRTMRATLTRARDSTFGAYDNKLPLEMQLRLAGTAGSHPQTDVYADAILNFHPESTTNRTCGGDDGLQLRPLRVLPQRRVEAQGPWAASDLVVTAAPTQRGELELWCSFNCQSFAPERIHAMGVALAELTRRALSDPDQPLEPIEPAPR